MFKKLHAKFFRNRFPGRGKVDTDHEKRVENEPGVTEEQLQQRDALLAAELNEWGKQTFPRPRPLSPTWFGTRVRNRQFVHNIAQCP